MERDILTDLLAWKNAPGRKPLIIRGARQVGKTWCMREFGKRYYAQTAYISFDNNPRMEQVFSGDFDLSRIILALSAETGIAIHAEDTLLIFDEIQEVPKALTALKYFYENAPEYQIVAAGSLLGIALHEGTSFPVGKVDFLDLYPLSFTEFLNAVGEEQLSALMEKQDWQLLSVFHEKLIDLLRRYLYVGGMPAVVSEFVNDNNYVSARRQQELLLEYYAQDFSKHVPENVVPRLRMVWDSVPMQLGKENKKFFFGKIRKGARAGDFEIAIQWLKDCGLIHQIYNVSKPAYPLKAYIQFTEFKIFLLDVGLLCAMAGVDAKSLLEGNAIFTEFKGALSEQFVAQELICGHQYTPLYYAPDTGRGEIDFMLQKDANVVPVEVKASGNVKQAQSLKAYHEKYSPGYAVRTSLLPYRQDDWLTNLPLYAIRFL